MQVFQEKRNFQAFCCVALKAMGHHFCHIQLMANKSENCSDSREGAIPSMIQSLQCTRPSHPSLSLSLKGAPSSLLLGSSDTLEGTTVNLLKRFLVLWPCLSLKVVGTLWDGLFPFPLPPVHGLCHCLTTTPSLCLSSCFTGPWEWSGSLMHVLAEGRMAQMSPLTIPPCQALALPHFLTEIDFPPWGGVGRHALKYVPESTGLQCLA